MSRIKSAVKQRFTALALFYNKLFDFKDIAVHNLIIGKQFAVNFRANALVNVKTAQPRVIRALYIGDIIVADHYRFASVEVISVD